MNGRQKLLEDSFNTILGLMTAISKSNGKSFSSCIVLSTALYEHLALSYILKNTEDLPENRHPSAYIKIKNQYVGFNKAIDNNTFSLIKDLRNKSCHEPYLYPKFLNIMIEQLYVITKESFINYMKVLYRLTYGERSSKITLEFTIEIVSKFFDALMCRRVVKQLAIF